MAPRRTCAFAVVGTFTCVLSVQIAAAQPSSAQQTSTQQTSTQQPPAQPASPATAAEGDDGAKLPVSLERIREGVARDPKLKIDFLDPNIPLFRISVQEKALALEDYWKIGPDTAVSRDVRPSFASTWHHEFLSMTTPKQHIAASPFGLFGNPVHPIGPPVLEITKAIKQVFSNAERGRIRRQIQEELKAIEANKAQEAQQQEPPPQQPPQTKETPRTTQAPAGSNGSTSKPVPNDPR